MKHYYILGTWRVKHSITLRMWFVFDMDHPLRGPIKQFNTEADARMWVLLNGVDVTESV